jgi:hypothetical protein
MKISEFIHFIGRPGMAGVVDAAAPGPIFLI